MQRPLISLCAIALTAVPLCAQDTKPADAQPAPKSVQERASYGLGFGMGETIRRNFEGQGIGVDFKMILRGISDGITGAESALSEKEIEEAMAAFEKEVRNQQAQKLLDANPELKALAEKNQREGKAFLEANAKKEGVKSTASGLQYQVLKSGAGQTPDANDEVTTHYHGTLIDGTVFDSSVDRGEPVSFSVGGVIAGWTEVLQLMKVGDKWKVFVPSDLAYGVSPRQGGKIGPNAVLVFEIELLGVEKVANDDAPAAPGEP